MTDHEFVHESLRTAHEMISKAYPNGLPDSDYFPLLAILSERMTHRDVVSAMLPFVRELPGVILNDIYRALFDESPSAEEIDRVRSNLKEAGVEKWAKQWEHIADDKELYK